MKKDAGDGRPEKGGDKDVVVIVVDLPFPNSGAALARLAKASEQHQLLLANAICIAAVIINEKNTEQGSILYPCA